MAASTSSYLAYFLWSAGIRLRRWSRILVTVAAGRWVVAESCVFFVPIILSLVVMILIVDTELRAVPFGLRAVPFGPRTVPFFVRAFVALVTGVTQDVMFSFVSSSFAASRASRSVARFSLPVLTIALSAAASSLKLGFRFLLLLGAVGFHAGEAGGVSPGVVGWSVAAALFSSSTALEKVAVTRAHLYGLGVMMMVPLTFAQTTC